MKITVNQLRKIIKEEISKSLNENNDVKKEVKKIILSLSPENKNKIAALLKNPTRTYESYSELMQPIMQPIINDIKVKYGDEGIDAYNSLVQTDPDLKKLLSFSDPREYRSSVASTSEPEDVSNSEYLNTIDIGRSLYGPGWLKVKLGSIGKFLFGTAIAGSVIKAVQKYASGDEVGLNGEDIVRLTILAKYGYYPLFYDHMVRKVPWADDDYIKEEYVRLGNEGKEPPHED